jgi:transposase
MSVFRYALAMSAAVVSDPDRDTQIAALTAALATAKAELAARDLLIETLRSQIARMRRMAFGASSEKLSAEIAQLELALEELEAAAVVTAIVSPVPKVERPVPVRALPDHLPRDEVVVEPASGPCACPDCGSPNCTPCSTMCCDACRPSR